MNRREMIRQSWGGFATVAALALPESAVKAAELQRGETRRPSLFWRLDLRSKLFVQVALKDLRKGDVFDIESKSPDLFRRRCIATSDPEIDKADGVWQIRGVDIAVVDMSV